MWPQIILLVLLSMVFSKRLGRGLSAKKVDAADVITTFIVHGILHSLPYAGGWYDVFLTG